jgi:NodT family efflux transporter outer membrane factor (OMF) lipoprotein
MAKWLRRHRHAMGVGMALALAGCASAPAYHPPQVGLPAGFAGTGPWVPADGGAAATPADWWTVLGDPVLNGLEQQLNAGNPSLAAAVARHDKATALLRQARADLYPQLGTSANLTENRQSDNRPLRGGTQPDTYGAQTVGLSGSYEADVWGRVRANVAAGRADAQAAADDVADTRLQLQAELAQGYAVLRGQDRIIALLDATVQTYAQADHMTQRRFAGGIANGMEIGQSATQLAEAQAALADARNARALAEHAIATLVGVPATGFAVAPADGALTVPAVPVGVPSTLLQRRPDIAAAERRMFAANRRIGVARAAFFPSLLLGGQVGLQDTALSSLIAAPNTFWSIGPSAVLTLFDGGRRHARVMQARADWDAATADYRGRVLAAVQDVEDGLSRLHHLGDESMAETRAAEQAGNVEALAMRRYERGAVSYLDVVNAQTTALRTRQKAIEVDTQRVQAAVRLLRATGGGWQGQAG